MWIPSWLRTNAGTRNPRPANRFRPQLEAMEDRAVPATFVVTTMADTVDAGDGVVSLREAILDSNARTTAATIVVPAGTYALTQTPVNTLVTGLTGDLDISASTNYPLTIRGAGAGTTVIDGGGLYRAFVITGFGAVSITDLTVQGGNAGKSSGGAIFSQYATLSINNCTFSGNSAGGAGGGAISAGGTLTVGNSTFSGNSATSPYLTGSASGGAINFVGSGTLTVSDSTFSNNSANWAGGAIRSSATATVSSSTFTGNSAQYGGGISNGGKMTVSNSTITGNFASQWGGGISSGKLLSLRGCTVSGNSAPIGPDIYGG